MIIRNTIPQIKAAFPDGAFDLARWRQYANGISPTLAQKCLDDIAGYDFQKEIVPVVQWALTQDLSPLARSFAAAVSAWEANASSLFSAEPEITVVLYLGLCSGAGWATQLDGRPAVLLGVEKILELNWQSEQDIKGLLFHELGHLWHQQRHDLSRNTEDVRQRAVLQLYREGVAMVCEQILCGDETFFHQDKDGWLDWCTENFPVIRADFRRRLVNGDQVQDYFGDWCSFRGHSDVGYFLGCMFIKHLRLTYDLQEIAALPYDTLERELFRFLGD